MYGEYNRMELKDVNDDHHDEKQNFNTALDLNFNGMQINLFMFK